jgi:hypothetical protein
MMLALVIAAVMLTASPMLGALWLSWRRGRHQGRLGF